MACPGQVPHGRTGCADGRCIVACDVGWDNCNGQLNDGCETSVLNDPRNCGACGMACESCEVCAGLACSSTCGQCKVCINNLCVGDSSGCLPGFGECDGDCRNGCETSLTNDPANCGKCGHACAQGQVCMWGVCK
jgi:hypothetical protein